jgi:hypothetical protein
MKLSFHSGYVWIQEPNSNSYRQIGKLHEVVVEGQQGAAQVRIMLSTPHPEIFNPLNFCSRPTSQQPNIRLVQGEVLPPPQAQIEYTNTLVDAPWVKALKEGKTFDEQGNPIELTEEQIRQTDEFISRRLEQIIQNQQLEMLTMVDKETGIEYAEDAPSNSLAEVEEHAKDLNKQMFVTTGFGVVEPGVEPAPGMIVEPLSIFDARRFQPRGARLEGRPQWRGELESGQTVQADSNTRERNRSDSSAEGAAPPDESDDLGD